MNRVASSQWSVADSQEMKNEEGRMKKKTGLKILKYTERIIISILNVIGKTISYVFSWEFFEKIFCILLIAMMISLLIYLWQYYQNGEILRKLLLEGNF